MRSETTTAGAGHFFSLSQHNSTFSPLILVGTKVSSLDTCKSNMTKNSLNLTSIVMLAHGFRVENGLLGISMFDIIVALCLLAIKEIV